jgi:hypothetical protein
VPLRGRFPRICHNSGDSAVGRRRPVRQSLHAHSFLTSTQRRTTCFSHNTKTEHLWSLAWGRNISRFLGLAIELDALGKMGEEPITVTEASVRWGLPETSARVLAQSLCCMRILVHKNGLLTKSELAQNLAAGGFLLDECRKPLPGATTSAAIASSSTSAAPQVVG